MISQAELDVLREHRRQMTEEGFTPEHDDQHTEGSLAIAAACYVLHDTASSKSVGAQFVGTQLTNVLWAWTGWSVRWFKPKDRRNNLVRAAALLLSEIERLDRAEKAK